MLTPIARTSDNRWSTACGFVRRLTAREYEIFLMLGDGLDNRRISSKLAICQRTVKFHVTSILRKLEVESRLQAGLAAAEYSRLQAELKLGAERPGGEPCPNRRVSGQLWPPSRPESVS